MSPFWTLVVVLLAAIAAGLCVVVWTLVRERVAREVARAQLLQQLAFSPSSPAPADSIFAESRVDSTFAKAMVDKASNWETEFASESGAPADLIGANDGGSDRTASFALGAATLLGTGASPSVGTAAAARRWLAVAGATAVLAASIGVYALAHRDSPGPVVSPALLGTDPAQPNQRVPVELVALQHERRDAGLVVSGTLRNPVNGAALANVEAVVDGFDGSGSVLTTRRTRIDRQMLSPGTSAAFSVELPTARVARYRVEFQIDGRDAVPHVDRRAGGPSTLLGAGLPASR